MNQLQNSILKFNTSEIKMLESLYCSGKSKADKKLTLLKLLQTGRRLSEKEVIKYIYGEAENARNNFRKLINRLEADLLNILNVHQKKITTSKSVDTIQSAELIRFLHGNQINSHHGKIATKFNLLESDADENRIYMNQIYIGRLRNESLYFQECPLNSLDKLRRAHRLSSYLTEATTFYLGTKYYFVNGYMEDDILIDLEQFKEMSGHHFEETDEPRIGFYYHMGAIVLSFFKEDHIALCYHIDKLLVLIQNNGYLNNKEYADEIIIFRFLSKESGYQKKREHHLNNFSVPLEFILSDNFILRNKNKPFELELLVRFCLYSGHIQKASQIIQLIKRNKAVSNHFNIIRKWEFFEMLAHHLNNDSIKAKTRLNKLGLYRNGLGIIRFYLPVLKFILNNQSVYSQCEIEVDSYRKNISRCLQKMEQYEKTPLTKRIKNQLLVLKQIIESENLSYEDCRKYKYNLVAKTDYLWGENTKVYLAVDEIITLEGWLDEQMKLIKKSS